jgi:hypothetical protein
MGASLDAKTLYHETAFRVVSVRRAAAAVAIRGVIKAVGISNNE